MTTGTLPFTQANGVDTTDFASLAGMTVPTVASNQLSGVTGGTTYAGISVVTMSLADMRIGITATAAIPASSSSLAIIARCDSSANGYSFEIQSGTWFINRLDGGTPTQLATGSRTSATNDLYEIEIIGTALKCYANGVQIGTTQTASLYTTNTKFGIVLLRNTGTLTADNMAYTDAFAPSAVTETRAVAENDGASLVWPVPTGGGAPTDYLIEKRIGPYPALTSQAGAPTQLTTVDNTAGTAYVYRWTGTGVTIFVPGAGVRGTHNEFTGRLGTGFNAGGGTPFTDGVPSPGHDTGTASVALGTTLGIAKGATVYPVRCMATDPGAGIPVSVANMRTGLAHILANAVVGHSVVFWSMLGYAAGDTDSDGHTVTSGDVTNITADVQAIIDAGIPVVTAAGNNAGTYNVTPQNMTDVINVGNCNATTLDKSTTSSFGTLIDIWAVASGTGTIEASNASDSATENGGGAGYNGTSEAAPVVAGTIACMLEAASYSLTPADAKTLLLAQATATGNVGAGSPTKLVNSLTDPQSWATISHSALTAPEFHVTGLTTADSVVFRVSGVNATGTGTASPASTQITVLGTHSIAHAFTALLGQYTYNLRRRWSIDTLGPDNVLKPKVRVITSSNAGAVGTSWDSAGAGLAIDYLWGAGAANATVTPATLATPISFPAPTVVSSPFTTPGVLATPIVFRALTVTSSPTVTPGVLGTPISFPAPAIVTSPTTSPATLATPISFPAPTVSGGTVTSPATLATPITLPAPTIISSPTTSPATLATPITFNSPVVVSSPTVSPAVLATPIAFPAPAASGGTSNTVTPSTLATPITFLSPAILLSPTVLPSSLATPIVFPSPTISSSPATAPSTMQTPISFPSPTVVTSPTVTPATLATPITFPAPAATGGTLVNPSTLATPITFNSATVVSSPSVTPTTLATPVSFPPPSVTAGTIASPATLATPITFRSVTIITSPNTAPSTIATPISFTVPTIGSSPNVTPATLATPIVMRAFTTTSSPTVSPSVLATPITFNGPTITGTTSSTVFPGTLATPIVFHTPTVSTAGAVLGPTITGPLTTSIFDVPRTTALLDVARTTVVLTTSRTTEVVY